jgi:hypothetical protein
MFSEGTIDCLPLANTAILIQLIKQPSDRGVVAEPNTLLRDPANDLTNVPNAALRVEDAVKLIRKEIMPRILEPARTG